MPDFIFRLPLDNQLTDAQRIALDYETSIVISGGPGSGKTVVTINRFLLPVKNNQDVMLFTYNRTLLAAIKGLLRAKSEEIFGELNEGAINNVINNNVESFSKFYGGIVYDNEVSVNNRFSNKINMRQGRKYSEIFFDEAQDLTPAVFAKAFILADKVSCGADNAQNLQGNFPPDESVEIILNNLRTQQHTDHQQLEANFRNTKEIFEFARGFVPDDENVQSIDVTELALGENPEILDNLNRDAQMVKIKEIIESSPTSNIGILVNYSNQVTDVKLYLEQNGYSCQANASENVSFSYYFNGMPALDEQIMFNRMRTPFIVTYDSCKGLEFDIVIMPFFNDSSNALNKPRPVKVRNAAGVWTPATNPDGTPIYEKNADGTIKMWATKNHYYVGATRARTSLYVLCYTRPDILSFHNDNDNDRITNLYNQTNPPEDDLPF
jgi:superfamily I DNA/RNA helicase